MPLYGKQESGGIGYNPAKKGRPSYHPLLCFNGLTRDYWQGELRPGDTHTATGAVELLQAVFARIPASVKVKIVRGDKGFYDHKTVEYMEGEKALFAIVARMTQPVKKKFAALTYKTYTSGTETSEFPCQPTHWKKAYRFIVIRRPIPEEASDQLTLFSLGKYSYQVIVTNPRINPLNVLKFYNARTGI